MTELWYGAEKRAAPQLTARLEVLLAAIEIVALEAPAERVDGRLRAQLERSGMLIRGNDLLIAAQAIALGLTLVSDNVAGFFRVADIALENWIR